jgi:hypothetical protein
MNMQDNDFDNLFRTKLDGLEVEPSARVWNNISAEVSGPQKRRLSPVWSIAATTVILMSAAAWFLTDKPVKVQQNRVAIQKKQSVIIDGPAKNKEASTPVAVQKEASVSGDNSIAINKLARVKQGILKRVNATAEAEKQDKAQPLNKDIAAPVVNLATQPVLAAVPAQSEHKAVVPDMSLSSPQLTATENSNQPAVTKVTEPVMASQPERKKKRGIHTLGGLINAVIAKVDKREDKLIEFTETDDDQADITGINLGLFKVKKEK